MKAILTTYKGPTHTKPARIIATDGDGNKAEIKPDSIQFDNYEQAERSRNALTHSRIFAPNTATTRTAEKRLTHSNGARHSRRS